MAASNRFGNRASFSNFGTGLAFTAPGQNIWSTDRTGTAGYASGNYAELLGTSFASPYAAGVAALILSFNPGLDAFQVEAIMQQSCVDMSTPGYDTNTGWGHVNAKAALDLATPPMLPKFSQPPMGEGEDVASNLTLPDMTFNTVISDDFVSDGRPITGVRWWGSRLGLIQGPICGDGIAYDPYEACDGSDDAACPGECQPDCTCPCPADFNVSGPGEFTGNTCSQGNDCAIRPSEEHIYRVDIPNDGLWTFSTCGSSFDTWLFVATDCCDGVLASNDDSCGVASEVSLNLTAGTYYALIEAFSGAGCGSYTLSINKAPPIGDDEEGGGSAVSTHFGSQDDRDTFGLLSLLRDSATGPEFDRAEALPEFSGGGASVSGADFQVDDGSAENSVGVSGLTFGWANRFTNHFGIPITLEAIEVAFGTPAGSTGVAAGNAVDAVIWIDVAATGDMTNAVKIIQWSLPGGVHANDATFAVHAVPSGGVTIPPGADFYVGLGDIQTQIDGLERYPAAWDTSSSAMRSWAFFGPTVFDPDDLASQTIGLLDAFLPPGGNWLIRARVVEPDGWLVSFHEPKSIGGSEQPPLAVYFCDQSAVSLTSTALGACDDHPVLQYDIRLADCCLNHATVDSRSGELPGEPGVFLEEECFDYTIGIQAVVGLRLLQDPLTMLCIQERLTGKSVEGDFWGWHTTEFACGAGLDPPLQSALYSQLTIEGPDWFYGPWNPVSPACSQANMAFELLTTEDPVTTDNNGNCIPDSCEEQIPDPMMPEPGGVDKVRFISFEVPANSTGSDTALRVELVSIDAPPGTPSGRQFRYVNAFEFDGTNHGTGLLYCPDTAPAFPDYACARLGCEPEYRDWMAELGGEVLHVTGDSIAPSSSFIVSHLAPTCGAAPGSDTCGSASTGLLLSTAIWGDVTGGMGGVPDDNVNVLVLLDM